jgi:hypothetical protein
VISIPINKEMAGWISSAEPPMHVVQQDGEEEKSGEKNGYEKEDIDKEKEEDKH